MAFNPDPKPIKEEKTKMSAYEYNAFRRNKNTKKNKFNAVKQNYNGYNYDSKREAQHAFELDMRIKAKEVKSWERQHKIELIVKGVRIANYFIDFKVYMKDGSVEYHEVKGAETGLWRLKWKLTKAIYPEYNLKLIK